MLAHRVTSWWAGSVAAGLAAALSVAACDTAPGPPPLDRQPPTVSNLVVAPDTVRPADLTPGGDASARVELTLSVEARDSDGVIDRVLVIIDPAYGPSAPGIARLDAVGDDRYGGVRGYPLATEQADVFTVRALAIDNDSLTSNEVVGRFHYIPDEAPAARP